MTRGGGSIQQKTLLLLLGGLALGVSGSPTRYFRIARAIGKEWRAINRRSLQRAIRSLYVAKLIEAREGRDGSTTFVLSSDGARRALTYRLDTMHIAKPPRWDEMWRIVTFDIPEQQKAARDAFRAHLKQLGFRELQRSTLIFPYPCSDEINFLIEFFHLRPYVRQLVVTAIDTDAHLRQQFGLPRHRNRRNAESAI